MSNSCPKQGCTVAETGICLLSHNPITACPNLVQAEVAPSTDSVATNLPADERPTELDSSSERRERGERRFHVGLELGTDDMLEVSRSRYCHLIGVLGVSDAGKTCCLLSLYLSALHGRLPNGYQFAGSVTLKGFEDRARKLREWKGGPLPKQLADHTVLGDARQAGLLHLALRQGAKGRRVDLLLTDLPGEWSKSLVDSAAAADKLRFLRRADGIILVVDGKRLESSEKAIEVLRTKHILERLKANVRISPSIPLVLLVSKGDEIGMRRPAGVDDIVQHGRTQGFNIESTVAAAFSYDKAIESGTGVFETIEKLIDNIQEPGQPTTVTIPKNARHFATFGGSRR